MTELSPEIKRLLREFKRNQRREATEADLKKILEPLIPTSIEEETTFIKRAKMVLEPPKEKPIKKQEEKPREEKPTLSPLQRAFLWFTTKIEEVRQQVEALSKRLTQGHGSEVNADKVDDMHAREIAQFALDILQAGRGGGVYAGFDRYTDAEAVSAVEAASLTLANDLDMNDNKIINTHDIYPYGTGQRALGSLSHKFSVGYINSIIGSLGSFSSSVSVDLLLEYSAGAGVTADGVKLKDSQVYTDQINEKTPTAGVTADGVQFKDGEVIFASDLKFKKYATNWLQLTNVAESQNQNLLMGTIKTIEWQSGYPTSKIKAYYPQGELEFQAYDSGWLKCANLGVRGTTSAWFDIPRAGDITMLDQKMMQLGTYTDAQRPAAGTAGRVIFNTDDGMPNYDDGTNWRDVNGNIT